MKRIKHRTKRRSKMLRISRIGFHYDLLRLARGNPKYFEGAVPFFNPKRVVFMFFDKDYHD